MLLPTICSTWFGKLSKFTVLKKHNRKKTEEIKKQDRFTTCFKIGGTISLFVRVGRGYKLQITFGAKTI